MEGLIMAAQLIAGLSILVILHELGHFLAARAFGITVEKFYLFFDAWGFKLFSFNYKGCEYGIGWLPLGGYVKIAGMVDESMDKEQLSAPAQPWEFRAKPAWQRLIVMIGGVTVNLILGIFIFWLLVWRNGEQYIDNQHLEDGIVAYELAEEIGLKTGDKVLTMNGKPVEVFEDLLGPDLLMGNVELTVDRKESDVEVFVPANFLERVSEVGPGKFLAPRMRIKVFEVVANSEAEKGGLKVDDIIVSINNQEAVFYDQYEQLIKATAGKTCKMGVVRNGELVNLTLTPDNNGLLGFRQGPPNLPTITKNYTLLEAIPEGYNKAIEMLMANIKGLGNVAADKAIQGPIGIAAIYGSSFDWDRFWTLTAMLSLVLAFMNILPIPALDGGHVIFLFIEMIIGRPLSDKFLMRAQVVGFVILISIMVFAFGNDILKFFK
jgi:regulator of sigma E protease